MAQAAPAAERHAALLAKRLVRYADLKPCTTAFIDTRTPGSAEKENFTIIGPGVSESADQHVHIDIPHGFNIGINQGPVAGAGISAHLHQHVVPRWGGDSNFLPIIARTKAVPVVLGETRVLLARSWPAADGVRVDLTPPAA
jgi:hypothetical protein